MFPTFHQLRGVAQCIASGPSSAQGRLIVCFRTYLDDLCRHGALDHSERERLLGMLPQAELDTAPHSRPVGERVA